MYETLPWRWWRGMLRVQCETLVGGSIVLEGMPTIGIQGVELDVVAQW
jgi:hypothetical protein